MRSSTAIILLTINVLVLCVSGSNAQTIREIPEGLAPAARQCFIDFIAKASSDYLAQYEWCTPEDITENFVSGEPYPIYILDIKQLADIDNRQDFVDALTFIDWIVPIFYNNEPRTLIRMHHVDEEWQRGQIGEDPSPIIYARSKWPFAEGYMHSYVLSPRGPDLLMVDNSQELRFYPFNMRNEFYFDIHKDDAGHYPVLSFDTMMMKLLDAVEAGRIRTTD